MGNECTLPRVEASSEEPRSLQQHATLGVIRLDYYYPTAPGDIDHPDSYVYDVVYRVVPGLTFAMCQSGKLTSDVEKELKDAISYLVSCNVSAITGDCGFMMYLQKLCREQTHIPIFMSALCQLPAVTCAFAHNEKIAIFTANGTTLEPMHDLIKDECAVEIHEDRYVIVGCEDVPGFEAVANGDHVDFKKVEPGIVAKAKEVLAKHGNIRAFLFECTELPQFSDSVRHATKLPVYDAITCANSFMHGLMDNPRFGKQNFMKDPQTLKDSYVYAANLTDAQKAKLVNKGPS